MQSLRNKHLIKKHVDLNSPLQAQAAVQL